VTPNLAILEGADANLRRADKLAELVLSFVEGLRQGLPVTESLRPRGQSAGVRQKEKWRVAEGWVFDIAFHRLSEVAADCDRLVSHDRS
jgi:hypothetical protein